MYVYVIFIYIYNTYVSPESSVSQLLGMYVLKSLVQTQTLQMIFAVFFAFSSSLLVDPKNFILLENLITIIAP